MKTETICFIEGKVDRRGREPNLIVSNMITMDEADKRFTDQVAIKFQRGLHSPEDIDRVRDLLKQYPGRCGVAVVVESYDERNPAQKFRYLLAPGQDVKVAVDNRLAESLQQILGVGNVRFLSTPKRKPAGNGQNGNGRRAAAAMSES